MKKHSETNPDWDNQRMKIIGLGESSIRKSYYPELQHQLAELQKKNEELRESEEKYRTLVNNAFDGVIIHHDGKIVFLNRTAVRLLGGTDPAEFLDRHIADFTRFEYRLKITERSCILPKSPKPVLEKIHRLDGASLDVELVANAVSWSGIPAVQFAFRDISELLKTQGELLKKNEELSAAYEELTATAEELQMNYDELNSSQRALEQARKKLSLLNTVTFQDIQSAVFSLAAYIELTRSSPGEAARQDYLEKELAIATRISDTLRFTKNYQEMGVVPSRWQNMNHIFLYAISHLTFPFRREISLGNLEIYADPLLEKIVFNLMENVVRHATGATVVTLRYVEKGDGLTLFIEDDGVGIAQDDKARIFERGYGKDTGLGLFLVREVLSITGMEIRETGKPGEGARFEIAVPKGAYRFV